MADSRNPCLKCDSRYFDKNNETCAECNLRINYVNSLGYFTDHGLNRTDSIEIKKQINGAREIPEIEAIFKKIRVQKDKSIATCCKTDGCVKTKIFAMGFCKMCYLRDLARRKVEGSYNPNMSRKSTRKCKEEGCNEKHYGLGYCVKHYKEKFLTNVMINKQIFMEASIAFSPNHEEISKKQIVEGILELFVKLKEVFRNNNG